MSTLVKIQDGDSVKIKIVKFWANLAIATRKLSKIEDEGGDINLAHVNKMIKYRQDIVRMTLCALRRNKDIFNEKMKQFIRDSMIETIKYSKPAQLVGGTKEEEEEEVCELITDADLEKELMSRAYMPDDESDDESDKYAKLVEAINTAAAQPSAEYKDVIEALNDEIKKTNEIGLMFELRDETPADKAERAIRIAARKAATKEPTATCGCAVSGGRTKNKRGKKTKRTNKKTRRNRKRR